MPRHSITDLSPRHQAEALRQLERSRLIGIARAEEPKADKPRIRQSSRGLNKTEADFAAWLRAHRGQLTIVCEQAITLKLGNGVRYTPDFVTSESASDVIGNGIALHAWEVKGPHAWDDAIVKLKVAAAQYRWIKFHLVSRGRDTLWRIENVRS